MDNQFFEQPILNSPYEYPARHWELDDQGQPTQQIIEKRRSAKFITPIPKPRKRKNKDTPQQQEFVFEEGKGISTKEQLPPCFIIVCNNTSTSKLVYDYISGFYRENEDGTSQLVNGRLELFRNFDEHGQQLGRSTLLFHVTKRLLYTKWRDPDKDPELHLFGQLKRITKQWLDNCLICKGGTYPAQLMYQELADMACERITAGITRSLIGERPVKAVLDPYSTIHVNFNTSKKSRWQTDARRCHINWVILDSDWEAEFCRVAESHPKVKAYVKNHNLGLEVPYRYGSDMRTYLPDFIVLIDDGQDDPLNLIIAIKGYRREDAKEKKSTMETYWVPGVNNHGHYGRWAFAEFTEVYQIEADFKAKVEEEFNKMIEEIIKGDG